MRRLAVAALIAMAAGMAPEPVRAQEPRLSRLDVSLDGSQVLATFSLEGAFDDELVERIQSGLPSGFVYRFQLYRDHKRWFDASLDRTVVEVVAMYNAVTQEHLVNTKLNDRLVSSQIVRDLPSLEQAMTHLTDVHLFDLSPDLPRDWRLLLRGRAELGSRTLLLFVPTTVATPWFRSRKFRAPAALEP